MTKVKLTEISWKFSMMKSCVLVLSHSALRWSKT